MVNFYVGQDRKHWSLHRNLLQSHAPCFHTDAESDVELLDHDPEGFRLLVGWLYRGHLTAAEGVTDEEKYRYAVSCHELYRLCDEFGIVSLKNSAMDMYRQCLNEAQLVPDADELGDIYSTAPANSPFRKLMVQIAARQIMDPDVERDVKSYRGSIQTNPDFAVELIQEIRMGTGRTLFEDPTAGPNPSYHDHSISEDARSSRTLLSSQSESADPASRSDQMDKGRKDGCKVPPNTPNDRTPSKTSTNSADTSAHPSAGVQGPEFEDSGAAAPTMISSNEHNSHSLTESAESKASDRWQKPSRTATPGSRKRSVQFKQMTPGSTPIKDWRPVEVSGMIEKFDWLNGQVPNKKGPRKLRTSGGPF